MDYTALARELLDKMVLMQKNKPLKDMDGFLRGGAFVLQYLWWRGESVLPSDLSAEMSISSARIAAMLNNLESKGLITRKSDQIDRRRILIDLTQEGRELAEQQSNEILLYATRTLSALGERDAAEYVRIMGRLAEIDAAYIQGEPPAAASPND